eukprot:5509958-Pleurochrysis_carterae.AAC.9
MRASKSANAGGCGAPSPICLSGLSSRAASPSRTHWLTFHAASHRIVHVVKGVETGRPMGLGGSWSAESNVESEVARELSSAPGMGGGENGSSAGSNPRGVATLEAAEPSGDVS